MTVFDVMCVISTVAILAYGLGMLMPNYVIYEKLFFDHDAWQRLMSAINGHQTTKKLFWVLNWGGVGLTWISWGLTMLFISIHDISHKNDFAVLNVGIWMVWLGIYSYIRSQKLWSPQGNIVNLILTLGMIAGWVVAAVDEA